MKHRTPKHDYKVVHLNLPDPVPAAEPFKFPGEQTRRPKQDPLSVASLTIPEFDRETMKYKGQPIHLTAIMRLTNAALKARGESQLDQNPGWLV